MSEMVKCKDCKWWDNPQNISQGECTFLKPLKEDEMLHENSSVYNYILIACGSDFGCVHGEKKE